MKVQPVGLWPIFIIGCCGMDMKVLSFSDGDRIGKKKIRNIFTELPRANAAKFTEKYHE